MTASVEDYRGFVGDEAVVDIHRQARRFYQRHIVFVSSTYQGGGVAEMMSSLVPLLNDVGLSCGWRILHGNADFFAITKKFHNALQGDDVRLSQMKRRLYLAANERFSVFTHLNHDCVVIHDPQPLPLIQFYRKHQPWVWRCHVDLSQPNAELWEYLRGFVLRYDRVIVSHESYRHADLPVPHSIIAPAIDPLAAKNADLPDTVLDRTLRKFQVPTDKPFICQVSRFDKWKDPVGVVDVFRKVRAEVDCRLVLCGSMATDDPEGEAIYERVRRAANNFLETGDVVLVRAENNVLVNALQRRAAVIIQKSLREGFGLTVSEALWKGRPVVASRVGGIPLQVEDGVTGFLVEPRDLDGCADHVVRLLKEPGLGEEMGRKGRETVRQKFLVTRLLRDYLELFGKLFDGYGGTS